MLKRFLALCMVATMLFSTNVLNVSANVVEEDYVVFPSDENFADRDYYRLRLNEELIEMEIVPIVLEDGTILVDVQTIGRAMGMGVTQSIPVGISSGIRTLTLTPFRGEGRTNTNKSLMFRENLRVALVEGEQFELETAPIVVDGVFMVPLEFLVRHSDLTAMVMEGTRMIFLDLPYNVVRRDALPHELVDSNRTYGMTIQNQEAMAEDDRTFNQYEAILEQIESDERMARFSYMSIHRNWDSMTMEEWNEIRRNMSEEEFRKLVGVTGNI